MSNHVVSASTPSSSTPGALPLPAAAFVPVFVATMQSRSLDQLSSIAIDLVGLYEKLGQRGVFSRGAASALHALVFGRFRESIPDDSILLTILAGEREDSSKTPRNRFRLATSPKPRWAKKTSLPNQNWQKKHLKTRGVHF
jgi:hypothetical protein